MAEESLLPRKELPAWSAANATDTHAQSSRRYRAARERPDLASEELQHPACLAPELEIQAASEPRLFQGTGASRFRRTVPWAL